ncbi:MAG: penicillin-binding protein [Coriobacteriia bacterium]|nr:penicillin-binding protein [Coriobacteriia bacterium]MBN2822070.1 penicillin-binding protein [Coriobacteriia bacterium]
MSRRTRLHRTRKSNTAIRVIFGGIAMLVALTVLLTGVGAAAAFSMFSGWLVDLPDLDDPTAFSVAQATKVYSADNKLIANLYLENRQVVDLDEISPYMQHALVAVEDERFYQHNGFDAVGIVRAFMTNLVAGGVSEGASTITQQYIRNTILADERYDISYRRKVREAYLAYELEQRMSKDEVLSMYLNTVYFGEGAYGAESAALTFFSKHASELTIAEAALLAGLVQSPSNLSPYDNAEGAVSRRQWVLSKMHEQGYITDEEYEAAKVEELSLGRAAQLDKSGVYSAPYFVAHVKKLLQDEYGTGLVFQGGLTVYTTLDTTTQDQAEAACRKIMNKDSDPDYALVAIEPESGKIKAMVGGRDWDTNKFNFATQAKRQPGSSFKMFTLVTALKQGMPPTRKIDSSSPAVIQTGGTPWRVTGGSKGYITLKQATVGSVNAAFARLIAEMGAEPVVETAHDMGITTDIEPYLSITLGSQEVTPLEMTASYATLANEGRHIPPVAIEKVLDSSGETIFEADHTGTQAISASVAYATTQILKGVISGGTATRANIGRPAAGKTGTTQDYRDAWFCGYTPQLACAVWMGYTPEKPMRNVHGITVFGGTFPAMIWAEFMKNALADTPKTDFKSAPAPKYTWKSEWDVPDIAVPDVKDMKQADAEKVITEAKLEAAFTSAYSPTVEAGRVISQSPAAGTKVKPAEVVTCVVSKGIDPSTPPEPVEPPEPDPTSTVPPTSTPTP